MVGRYSQRRRRLPGVLNHHTHCHNLWSRALEALPDGSVAWKWSPTNLFVNRTGRLHARGVWADYENEHAIYRNFHGKIPDDPYISDCFWHARELRMHFPPADFRVADEPHETFVDTLGYIHPCGYRLTWDDDAIQQTSLLDGVWHSKKRLCDECRRVLS